MAQLEVEFDDIGKIPQANDSKLPEITPTAAAPSLGQIRKKCKELWGKGWYDEPENVQMARKLVAAAAIGGPAADEASIALAGGVPAEVSECIQGTFDDSSPPQPEISIDCEVEVELVDEPVAVIGVDIDVHTAVLGEADKALQWLTSQHLQLEGLWRTSPSKKEVRRLVGVTNNLGAFPWEELIRPELVTSLLINLLQKLPEGLVDGPTTAAVLEKFNSSETTAESLLEFIRGSISANKWQLMQLFVDHWRLVVGTAENKMNANGVATCVFAVVFPCVMDMKLIEVLEKILDNAPADLQVSQSDPQVPTAAPPSLGQIRKKCKELWGKGWYDEPEHVQMARKLVAAAAIGGPAADEASIALAGGVPAEVSECIQGTFDDLSPPNVEVSVDIGGAGSFQLTCNVISRGSTQVVVLQVTYPVQIDCALGLSLCVLSYLIPHTHTHTYSFSDSLSHTHYLLYLLL